MKVSPHLGGGGVVQFPWGSPLVMVQSRERKSDTVAWFKRAKLMDIFYSIPAATTTTAKTGDESHCGLQLKNMPLRKRQSKLYCKNNAQNVAYTLSL